MSDNETFISIAELQKLIGGANNSHSIAMLNSVMAETIGMSMHNAVSTQHNAQMLNSAATTSTCARILSVIGVKQDTEHPSVNPDEKAVVKSKVDSKVNSGNDVDPDTTETIES